MISITLVTTLALAAAAPSAAPSAQARKVYGACIQKVIKAKTADKLSGDAFTAAVKSTCANEEAAFVKSLVDYDVASGLKRADAEEGARLQVEDYLINASDTYATYADPK
ncbi:hypothetical protein E2493_15465 [Sphingomonas parva]|uniref:Uncharacterized protein n=1 Tax=Sphingomonas parva TaxID=2555898 RepID=A0A4Y8ZN12_9SPHN|nr:hypothetical protein [Sphingomonas parva]TFI57381.1 hypothetical protein E2493_15465 [Sphingomonas parva]